MSKSSGIGWGVRTRKRITTYLSFSIMTAVTLGGILPLMAPQKGNAETLYDILQRRRTTNVGQQLNPHFQPPRRGVYMNPPSRFRPTAPQSLPPNAQPIKRATIAKPRIYDYKPEKLVNLDFSSLDFQKTAAIGEAASQENTTRIDNISSYLGSVVGIRAEEKIVTALQEYYTANPALLWSKNGVITQGANQVMDLLARADEEGLTAEDYQITLPDSTLPKPEYQQALAYFDVMLSARVMRFAQDIHGGRIVADKLSAYHDLPRHMVDFSALLQDLSTSSQPAALLEAQAPQSDWYIALKLALVEIRETSGEIDMPLADNMLLRPGQNHEALPRLISLLKKRGSAEYLAQYSDLLDKYRDKTLYEEDLKPAIVAFQKSVGKTGDGVVGPATISALQGESNKLKEQRLILAMERLRWLPRDFSDRYVFINQPAYQAQYFENGVEKFAMRTVIGSPSNQTYFFYDQISLVTFNPSWGVPRSIIFNEMMPKILNDPSYLTRNGYEVYGVSGKRLDPYAVDWANIASKGHGVNIRQKPGKGNSLGELKILFPNKHDIYLHDTPSKKLFERDTRALSHGCVRLADPRKMAAAVMGVEVEDLKRYFGKQENNIQVAQKVPVFLTYFTAWPDAKSGIVHYYQDIYGRDKALEQAAQKTTQSRLGA